MEVSAQYQVPAAISLRDWVAPEHVRAVWGREYLLPLLGIESLPLAVTHRFTDLTIPASN
jgi:hypothetical protein